MIDYSKIPTADLQALEKGDYSKVSTPTLQMLNSAPSEPQSFMSKVGQELRDYPSQVEGLMNQAPFEAVRPGETGMFGQQFAPADMQQQHHQQMAHGLAQSLPFLAGTASGIGAETLAAPAIESLIARGGGGALARILGSTASGALGGATGSAAMGEDPSTGALIGGPLGAAGQSLSEALPAAARAVRGQRSPQEIREAAQQIPEGIKLPLGGIAQSPLLQSIEGKLSAVPLSGGKDPYFKLNDYLKNSLDNITTQRPLSKAAIDEKAAQEFNDNYQPLVDKTHAAYNALTDEAQKVQDTGTLPPIAGVRPQAQIHPNYRFDRSKFSAALKKVENEINPLLKNNPSNKTYKYAKDLLDEYNNNKVPTFNDAKQIAQGLNSEYKKLLHPSDYAERRYVNILKDGIEDAINDNTSKFPELTRLRDEANTARKEQSNFEQLPDGSSSPFFKIEKNPRNTDYYRFVDKHFKSPDTLNWLSDKVSPDTLREIATNKIKPSGDESIAQQIRNIKKLAPEYLETLLGDKKSIADEIKSLSTMYPKGKSPGFEPETGYQVGKYLGPGGAIAGLATHHFPLAASIIGTMSGANLMNRILRSPALREAYLRNVGRTPRLTSPVRRQVARSLIQEENK